MQMFKQLVLEVQRFFPELVRTIFIVNAPMFFDAPWETQLSQSVHENTVKKVIISAKDTCDELLQEVDPHDLPALYGGVCECEATCIYSEKGPWSEVENFINYKDPKPSSDDDVSDTDERANFKVKVNMNMAMGMQMNEEFKMMEGEEDQVDLLNEKTKSKNIQEFYESEDIMNLKNQIQMNVPGLVSRMHGMPAFSHNQTNNNTEAGDTESSEEHAQRLQQMKSMFNNNLINVPGLNPSNKNKFNETPLHTEENIKER